MKKMILLICCALGGVITCIGILFGIILIGDYISGLHTVDTKPFKEKYAGYADALDTYDERIIVYGTNGDFTEGSCWQCYNFDLEGLCYNFLFECNIYGEERMTIELSRATEKISDADDLALFITVCKDFSKNAFSEIFLKEKCEEALKTGYGRLLKDYYFELDEYGVLRFYGCPK